MSSYPYASSPYASQQVVPYYQTAPDPYGRSYLMQAPPPCIGGYSFRGAPIQSFDNQTAYPPNLGPIIDRAGVVHRVGEVQRNTLTNGTIHPFGVPEREVLFRVSPYNFYPPPLPLPYPVGYNPYNDAGYDMDRNPYAFSSRTSSGSHINDTLGAALVLGGVAAGSVAATAALATAAFRGGVEAAAGIATAGTFGACCIS